MTSLATLKTRAKRGDVEALVALMKLVESDDQSKVIEAVRAIGNAGTSSSWEAIGRIALESPNLGARHVAYTQIDKALKKSKEAVELLLRICDDPRSDAQDGFIASLANLISNDPKVTKDPRVLSSLRRAIRAEHIYVQEAAIAGLIEADDTASLPAILELLDIEERRGPDFLMFIGEAIVDLGGSDADLERLRARCEKLDKKQDHIDEWMKRLRARMKRKKK